MATVRSDAVRATFSASGSIFSMGLNRLTTRSSFSWDEIRFLGSSCPQAARSSARAAKTIDQTQRFLLTFDLPFD